MFSTITGRSTINMPDNFGFDDTTRLKLQQASDAVVFDKSLGYRYPWEPPSVTPQPDDDVPDDFPDDFPDENPDDNPDDVQSPAPSGSPTERPSKSTSKSPSVAPIQSPSTAPTKTPSSPPPIAATPTTNPNVIEWQILPGGYPDRVARFGETITFNYGPSHNVYIHPTGDCDETGRVLVGGNGGPASYTFVRDDVGRTITFACDVGSHCESGQIVSFRVLMNQRKVPPSKNSKGGLKMARRKTGTDFERARTGGAIRGGGRRRLANNSPEETQWQYHYL